MACGARGVSSNLDAFTYPWLLELLYGPPEEATVFGATEMNAPPLMGMGEDSMEPTILEGNLLLIDRSFGLSSMERRRAQSEGRPINDGIHAFKSRSLPESSNDSTGHLVIRRAQYRLDGTTVIRCDNPNCPKKSILCGRTSGRYRLAVYCGAHSHLTAATPARIQLATPDLGN